MHPDSIAPAVLFTTAGLAMTATWLTAVIRGHLSASWPVTVGRVHESHIAAALARFPYIYTPDVRYEYVVDGKRYEGATVSYTACYTSPSALDASQGFVPGHSVRIHYDPRDPSRSVLCPGVTVGSAVWMVFAALCLLFSLRFLAWAVYGP
jgi:hypothetical protein